jgi:serine/threonine protein kinase
MADFGFAKKLAPGQKTYTLCGTPEYLAPELVSQTGHTGSVDWCAVCLSVCLSVYVTGRTGSADGVLSVCLSVCLSGHTGSVAMVCCLSVQTDWAHRIHGHGVLSRPSP